MNQDTFAEAILYYTQSVQNMVGWRKIAFAKGIEEIVSGKGNPQEIKSALMGLGYFPFEINQAITESGGSPL